MDTTPADLTLSPEFTAALNASPALRKVFEAADALMEKQVLAVETFAEVTSSLVRGIKPEAARITFGGDGVNLYAVIDTDQVVTAAQDELVRVLQLHQLVFGATPIACIDVQSGTFTTPDLDVIS